MTDHPPEDMHRAIANALGLDDIRVLTPTQDVRAAEREQWDDGCNVLTVDPGRGRAYERNVTSNTFLRAQRRRGRHHRGQRARPRPRRTAVHELPDRAGGDLDAGQPARPQHPTEAALDRGAGPLTCGSSRRSAATRCCTGASARTRPPRSPTSSASVHGAGPAGRGPRAGHHPRQRAAGGRAGPGERRGPAADGAVPVRRPGRPDPGHDRLLAAAGAAERAAGPPGRQHHQPDARAPRTTRPSRTRRSSSARSTRGPRRRSWRRPAAGACARTAPVTLAPRGRLARSRSGSWRPG